MMDLERFLSMKLSRMLFVQVLVTGRMNKELFESIRAYAHIGPEMIFDKIFSDVSTVNVTETDIRWNVL
ncbi:hypothetical protein X777_16188 [Ooceraea biroi]|uniref:Uncharacterized protein n=1 Tax=Ooceraea biroi TaxID=2015173 RepID=A0A026WVA8_OOCBI|nr:hypothetical protein X777_16188 [Ooceraea biroi]